MSRTAAAIDAAFDPGLVESLVRVVRGGYAAAGRHHVEDDGCNGFTYGTILYHFLRHRLIQLAETEGQVEIAPCDHELEFRLQIGPFRIACHRVGTSADDPIEASFPSSHGAAGKLAIENAIQLSLGLPIEDAVPENLVLAHMGNPGDGLQALYLAAPIASHDGGRISSWGFTRRLWIVDEETRRPPVADLPKPATIPEPVVRLRDRRSESEAG